MKEDEEEETMKNDIKKGSIVRVADSDGGFTFAKVVEVGDTILIVKWLEARWDLRNNVKLARKGTK